ncbi:MAG: DUF5668 domain-containing protein [Candidatus Komeilibacteria bacterium]|nr:DUF5668 domain-containing protein [Candidatus Komeilibacteria bacterium]
MFLILLGLIFLLGTMNVLSSGTVAVLWPLLLIVAGLAKMNSHKCKCC